MVMASIRAVAYARFSSENQREASIEDQVEVCRRYAERQGWAIGAVYSDRAASGASTIGRPGFLRMLADAEAGRFDVVVCEAIDRLGRKLSDVASAFDRLSFARVTVHATAIGLVTQMHIGIMGTMAQMALTDLREKTKRGQLGRARAGKIPGGLAYGYEVVPPAPGSQEAGERRIKPDEAERVRRIFPRLRRRKVSAGHRARVERCWSARAGRAPLGRYDHPWAGRPWHRPAEQQPLHWQALLEPLQLRERPAHRSPGRAAEQCRPVGGGAGPRPPHH